MGGEWLHKMPRIELINSAFMQILALAMPRIPHILAGGGRSMVYTRFHWNLEQLLGPLAALRRRQVTLLGLMQRFRSQVRNLRVLENLTLNVLKPGENEVVRRRTGVEVVTQAYWRSGKVRWAACDAPFGCSSRLVPTCANPLTLLRGMKHGQQDSL